MGRIMRGTNRRTPRFMYAGVGEVRGGARDGDARRCTGGREFDGFHAR
jgi:hypothetical protein